MTYPAHPAADLFPMLDEADLQALAEDIKANGLHEPVWLYEDPESGTVILDGRNRLAACALVGVEPRTRRYTGPDPIKFALSLNLQRRHLSPTQQAVVALDVIPLYEAEARRKQKFAAGTRSNPGRRQVEAPGPQPAKQREPQARDKAATAVGASGRTVARTKRVAEKAPDLVPAMRSGELEAKRAERIVRDREAAERRQREAAQQVAQLEVGTKVDIRHGDFREVLADLENVDAIITDPPYPREFIPLLEDLAAWADKVLAPDGILAVLMGQTYLPEVYRLLDGHRPYRWTGCYLTPGSGYASMARKVQSNWKPLLIYGGGRRFSDTFRSEASDADAKDRHKWGQDYGAFHEIVRRLTEPGQTVVDPFMGSGTTLIAARSLGRHAIGCDVDGSHVDNARRWLDGKP